MLDRKLGIIVASLLFYASAAWAQRAPSDWFIVPGERVGAITATTSEAMLGLLFGANNVEPVDVYLGEGFTQPGTAVYPKDPAQRLEVVWQDDARTAPKEIRLTGNSSKWSTAEGISLGSTLKEVERLNGYPFRLAGFAFDYSGTITDCGRGRLTWLGCADRSLVRLVVLRLGTSAGARAHAEYHQVLGDRDFSSGHPAMQALNPSVYQIIVQLSH